MTPSRKLAVAAFAGTAMLVSGAAAVAQKSADTMRVALAEPLPRIDSYYFGSSDAAFYYQEIYEPLMRYDERTAQFVPRLAKAFRRIDPTTLEFDLDESIVFHNGSKFDADDVVHIVEWRKAPTLRIRAVGRLAWMKGAEKLGPYKVRIHSLQPTAADMMLLTGHLYIYDSDIHAKLDDKSLYGITPIGTGPLKVTKFDTQSQTLHIERFEPYDHGPKALYKRYVGVPIPDRETQAFHLISGTIDVMEAASKDQFDELRKAPGIVGYSRKQFQNLQIDLDARGRAGQPALKDKRVRRAILMAIDREALAKNMVPGESFVVDGHCYPEMFGCPQDFPKPPAYDPQGARKLLAEAGYPDGFELTIVTRQLSREAGIAVSGMLNEIGIKAKVNHVSMVAYGKLRQDGKIQAVVADMPVGGAAADASNPFRILLDSEAQAYTDDPRLFTLHERGLTTLDLPQRQAIYREMHQIMAEEAYSMPIANWPDTYLHSKDVTIESRTWSAAVSILDLGWAK